MCKAVWGLQRGESVDSDRHAGMAAKRHDSHVVFAFVP